ncbi:MAG: FAD-dependent oxidoreductase [Candidatus Omnitrophica bacterium]|nr:FAD-dependent oxidoreductase [Candidatus Omnitrophota bacterium]
MRKVIIIGAGFAGLSAAGRLSRYNLSTEVLVFDKKDSSAFLPLLPDAIGRRLNPGLLAYNIDELSRKLNFKFIKEEITSVDLQARQVFTGRSSYAYDALLISSGSQTDFFGNQHAQLHSYALNSVDDVKRITDAIKADKFENFIICGGGYTGVEAATNLWLLCRKNGFSGKIVIVERSAQILGPLPLWMKSYVRNNLKNMGIEVLVNSVTEDIRQDRVSVSGNLLFEKAMLVWVPGVKTADFIQKLAVEKNPQGRITVDEYLRFKEDCFCAGDASFFGRKGNYLRMAVQFSIAEGACAADNIIRGMEKLPFKKFKPCDLGYIIPMANNKSCGMVFGLNLKGFLPTLLHFIMCIYRSSGLRNKIGLAGSLIRSCLFTDS